MKKKIWVLCLSDMMNDIVGKILPSIFLKNTFKMPCAKSFGELGWLEVKKNLLPLTNEMDN